MCIWRHSLQTDVVDLFPDDEHCCAVTEPWPTKPVIVRHKESSQDEKQPRGCPATNGF